MKKSFLLLAVITIACLFCSGCSSEPDNLHDMLLYVNENHPKNSEKTLAAYKKFGPAGEEALIRTYFGFDAEKQPFYTKKLGAVYSVSTYQFIEALAKDKEFLRRIIAIFDAYPQSEYTRTGCYKVVLDNDKELFMAWFMEMSPKHPQYSTLGRAYVAKYPEEAITLTITLLEKNIDAAKEGSYKLPFWTQFTKKDWARLTPQQYHFIYSNRFDTRYFQNGMLIDWLLLCPEDFSLAVWREQNKNLLPQDLRSSRGIFPFIPIIPVDYANSAVKPSKQGNKTVVIYDASKIAKYSDGIYDTTKGISMMMMRWLPKNTTPDHLFCYDKIILIIPRENIVNEIKSSSELEVIQWSVTVQYIDPHAGKIISTKEFFGSRPTPGLTQLSKNAKCVDGSLPMKDVEVYMQTLINK